VSKCSSLAGDNSSVSPSLGKNVIPESSDVSSCRRLSFVHTVSAKPSQAVVEAETKTAASPGDIVLDVNGGVSAEKSTSSARHRRSRKFTDVTTWSRFRQQKTTALKSCSLEKVFVFQLCIDY